MLLTVRELERKDWSDQKYSDRRELRRTQQKHQAISTVKHALTAQEDALDMAEAANSPQHTREEHTALVYMQKGSVSINIMLI